MAEHEALRSAAASSLFHRMGHEGAQFEWCGELDDASHWTLTRVRGDAAFNPIAVGHFTGVGVALLALSQAKARLADVSPPKIIFGGAPRHLEASRGKYVLGHASAGDATVLLGALGREVALIYLAPAASPQVLHVCPPLALTCFDVDRVVKLRSCADAATSTAAGPAMASVEAAPEPRASEPRARRKSPSPSDATTPRGAARDDEPGLAVTVNIPAKVRVEHRRTVYGVIGNAVGPSLDDAIVNAFYALVDRVRLYVPPKGRKALGIQDVERVVEFFLQLAAQGCRDFGGLSGTIHQGISDRLPEFDVPRYAFARVLKLLHGVGTCILEKPSERRSQLRFVGLNDPTSELHRRFVAETETLCVIKLPPGTVPPEPRPRRERVQRRGKGDAKPRAGAGDAPAALGPRADGAASAGDEPVLGDTRGAPAGQHGGRGAGDEPAGDEPGARGEQLDPPVDAEFGRDGEPWGRGADRGASELRAALDDLVRGLFGVDEESRAGFDPVEPAAAPHVEAEMGPAREQEDEPPLDDDDVVRMLLGLGRSPTGVPVDASVPDGELALDELRGEDGEPVLDELRGEDGEPALGKLRELDGEPALDELRLPDGEHALDELRMTDGEPALDELRLPDGEHALDELRGPDGEHAVDELRLPDGEPALDELRVLDGEPALDELRLPDGEPALDELRLPDGEPALDELRLPDGEPALDELRGLAVSIEPLAEMQDEERSGGANDDEPPVEFAAQGAADGSSESPLAGRGPELWSCDGEPPPELPHDGGVGVLREHGDAGWIRELGEPLVSYDRMARERLSIVGAEAGGEDRSDLWRDPIPPALDFRVALTGRATVAPRLRTTILAAAARVWCSSMRLASSSMFMPRRRRVVSYAWRSGVRGLGLLGPRGPPRPRVPGAVPWGDCQARPRSEAETDRGRVSGRTGALGRDHLSGDVAVLLRRIDPTRSQLHDMVRTAASPRLWHCRADQVRCGATRPGPRGRHGQRERSLRRALSRSPANPRASSDEAGTEPEISPRILVAGGIDRSASAPVWSTTGRYREWD